MVKKWKQPDLEPTNIIKTKWGWAVQYPENFKLGKNTDIGYGTYINATYEVVIEDDVKIGGGCHIYSYDSIGGVCGKVWLKKGCKIGAHTVILPGVTVEENVIVGAQSFIPSDTILKEGVYAGIPVKKIR